MNEWLNSWGWEVRRKLRYKHPALHVANPLLYGHRVHQWRQELCDGRVLERLDWVGSNRIYTNATCEEARACTVSLEIWGHVVVEGFTRMTYFTRLADLVGSVLEVPLWLVYGLPIGENPIETR